MPRPVAIGALPRLALAVVTAAVALGALPARAELIVLQSSVPAIKVGQTLADSLAIEIPAGSSAVFVLPNGATRTVAGPFKGTVGDLTKGVAVDRELLGAVKTYVETGGASAGRVGATRSARPAPAAPAGFAGWTSVPITANGDHCIEAGKKPTLVRTYAGAPLTVTIANLATSERGRVAFAEGEKSVPWPTEVTLTHGATYGLAAADLPMRKLQLRLVKPLPAADDTLRVLHGQRCIVQMRAWLDGLIRQQASR